MFSIQTERCVTFPNYGIYYELGREFKLKPLTPTGDVSHFAVIALNLTSKT